MVIKWDNLFVDLGFILLCCDNFWQFFRNIMDTNCNWPYPEKNDMIKVKDETKDCCQDNEIVVGQREPFGQIVGWIS